MLLLILSFIVLHEKESGNTQEGSMQTTPTSLRIHIGLFGRMNTGKSSFLNLITGQHTAIVSPVAGTTTDVVSKPMELSPLGPVVFLDTAGLDDTSPLGEQRIQRTKNALGKTDIALLVCESELWGDYEKNMVKACKEQNTPLIFIVNKTDLASPSDSFLDTLKLNSPHIITCSSTTSDRNLVVHALKQALLAVCPEDVLNAATILGDLLPNGTQLPLVICIVPVDTQAPKGRLILPQVQTIRDCLDHQAAVVVVKEDAYPQMLQKLSVLPDLVVCDSQVVDLMVRHTPEEVPCTTFSILFSRFKGDIELMAAGAGVLASLRAGDQVLIAEACTHHPMMDDIARVKIPRWIEENCGTGIEITTVAGRDYPEDLNHYRLILHCGGCTLNKREMLWRIEQAPEFSVPITNYGIAISVLHGVVERTLAPFPEALEAYLQAKKSK
jgi:[FeFe] hydrogenase H-cluster maturation GTPase HydF